MNPSLRPPPGIVILNVSPDSALFQSKITRVRFGPLWRLKPVLIILERDGGIMGRKIRGSLNSDALPSRLARRLDALVKRSRFFELPIRLEPEQPAPDRFTYRLTIESDQAAHTIEVSEAALPDDLRPLLTFLNSSLLLK